MNNIYFTRAVSRRYRDRGQRQENPDRAKGQSDCRVRYRALLEKYLLPVRLPIGPCRLSNRSDKLELLLTTEGA